MAAIMLVKTTGGLRESRTDSFRSSDPKAVVEFLRGNCLTMGQSLQYARNPDTDDIIEVVKTGRPVQRDIKPLLEHGYTEWLFSWAFASRLFRLEDGREVQVSRTLDLISTASALEWGRAMGLWRG